MVNSSARLALHPLRLARLALAVAAQVIPGINSGGVAIVPLEAECVIADRLGRFRPRGRLVHGQQSRGLRLGNPRLASLRLALLVAGRAGAGVPQPGEAPVAAMAVLPRDLQPLSAGLLDAHLDRRDCFAGQRRGLTVRFFSADQTDSFVTHRYQFRCETTAIETL